MYATCLWCQRSLGRNETVEAFPVGRRLAFDAAKGRLWVVCPRCERWNLTPLEERWEAIEGCERLYRDTRTRVATENVGLARVGDGLELVRIGAPLRPEFAAWRYGDQFGRRRRRAIAFGVGAGVFGAAVLAGPAFIGIGGFPLARLAWTAAKESRRKRVMTHLDDGAGGTLPVTRMAVHSARVALDGGRMRLALMRRDASPSNEIGADRDPFVLKDRVDAGKNIPVSRYDLREWFFLGGAAAREGFARILPHVNASGGSRLDVADAVRAVTEATGDPVAHLMGRRSTPSAPLSKAVPAHRLALEMALHEADERRWMEGELADLEARWQEAEALAAIADRLAVPASAEATLDRLRGGGAAPPREPPSEGRS